MKAKAKDDSPVEKRLNSVFKSRSENLDTFASAKRVPKQPHFATSEKKDNRDSR